MSADEGPPAAQHAHAPGAGPRIAMPSLIYGTAWKGPASTPLVTTALLTGFRAIDTAAQLKHYDEAAVGQGIRDALSTSSSLTRAQIWIQTKCTPPAGQDWEGWVPYARGERAALVVRQSFARSLWNLAVDEGWRGAHPPPGGVAAAGVRDANAKGKQRELSGSEVLSPLDVLSDAAVSRLPHETDDRGPRYPSDGSTLYPHLRPRTSSAEPYVDCYLLHSPFDSLEETVEAWREMEHLVRMGWIRRIGLSNVYDPRILQVLRAQFVGMPSVPLGHAEMMGEEGVPTTYPIAPTILQNRWHGSTLHDVSLFSLLSPTLSPNDFADIAGQIQSQKDLADGALERARLAVDSVEPRGLEPGELEHGTDDPSRVQPVTYQAFWILTGNPALLTRGSVLESVQILNTYLPQPCSPPRSPEREREGRRDDGTNEELREAVRYTRWTPQMLLYATVALGLGGVPGLSTSVLCGSTDRVHMLEALVAVRRAEGLLVAESSGGLGAELGPKEREREEAHCVALREAVDAIRREIYGE
ncbi:hypothetical protein A4X06_0g4796 [Tilletia controversa]|uniref:NADP-dependent oxidoreductase domain-containing protein n=1 Tax=Tilletia controversa TaxID=13291 RepID=A0A8X7MRU3_9BASI|nr:hypothetical protein A4X06_0g4796 [Tilletia controversa]